MLYRFGAGTPIVQLLDVTLFCAYLLCSLLMVGFVVAVSLSRRIGWNDAAFGALVGTFPNTGFMGVPLLVALLRCRGCGPRDRDHFGGLDHHLVFVHCLVALRRGG